MSRHLTVFVALALLSVLLVSSWQIAQSDETAATTRQNEFEGWQKPEVALLITGRQHGYIEPCGCTGLANQKGGMARRHSLLKQLKAKGWDVVPLDVGNQVRRFGAQAAAKFLSTVDGLREMEYGAVAFGPDDLRLTLGDLIAAVASQTGESDLFICANANPAGFVEGFRVIEAGGMRIGVAAVLGTEQLARVTQEDIFKSAPMESLKDTMVQMKAANCDFQVLLSHASIDESSLFAKAFPQLDLVVTAGGAGEPTFKPQEIAGAKAVMIQAGTKGMYAGVVGIYKQGEDRLKYQRIPLDDRFEDSTEMLDILAAYQDKLKQQGLAGLGLSPVAHPSGRKYVGSESCGDCHVQAYEKWLETPHAHATDSISQPTERADIPRHHDPECISCHVTGWDPQRYIPYDSGYLDLEKSALLHGNGCENCHGPGAGHAAAEAEGATVTDEVKMQLRDLMKLPLSKARDKCMTCHDLDNSPDFHEDGAFEDIYWPEVEHYGKD